MNTDLPTDSRGAADVDLPSSVALALTLPQAPRAAALPSDGEPPFTRVESFLLLEPIGSGGQGVVYSAFDERLERRVALKVVRRSRDDHPRAQQRLLREAQALARLAHPNVVAVHHVGAFPDGRVFLAMEHVKGVTLRTWQAAAPRSRPELLAMYIAAGRGLSAAHRAGIIHRDFKPDNVLVGEDGRPRVVDFGLACDALGSQPLAEVSTLSDSPIASDALAPIAQGTNPAAGTPGYMAPEQRRGEAIDARSDQFSFCVALHEALCGGRPAAGSEPPRSLPERLRAVLRRGILQDPAARFPSMDALLDALSAAAHPRRRALLVVGALGLLLLCGAAADGLRGRAARLCAPDPAALSGVWDAAAHARVAAALARAAPFAQPLAPRVLAALDDYAAGWLAAQRASCEATHRHHTQSVAQQERRGECLAQRRRVLAATAEVFSTQAERAAERAGELLAGLGSFDLCSDAEALRLGTPVPPSRAALVDVDRLRGLLARGDARLISEDLVGARAALSEATALQQRLGLASTEGEVQHLAARVGLKAGALKEGVAALQRALALATSTRNDALQAALWYTLASEAGPGHSPPEEALGWCQQAEAWGERLRPQDALARRALASVRANLLIAAGRAAEARQLLEQALAGPPPPPALHLRLLRGRAIARAALTDKAGALADYQEAIALAVGRYGPDHPEVARSQRALGVLKVERLGDNAGGVADIERALRSLRAAYGAANPEIGNCQQALSQAALFRGDYDAALQHAEAARATYAATLGLRHRRYGEALLAVGVLQYFKKDYAASLRAYQQALAILQASLGAEHFDVGVLLSNIGETLLVLGEPDDAIRHFEQAVVILRRARGPDAVEQAQPLKGLGLSHLRKGRPALARWSLEQALPLLQREGGDPQELAETRWALAQALHDDLPRAGALARAARDAYLALGPTWSERAREISRFVDKMPKEDHR